MLYANIKGASLIDIIHYFNMIITAFLNIIYFILTPLVNLIANLADVSLSSSFATSVSTASSYLASLNTFLPIATITTILGVFLAYELSYFTFKLIYWIIKRIPTQS